MEPIIIYRDKNLLALNKPAGLLVHGIAGNQKEASLADWLLKHYPEVRTVGDDPVNRPGIVHRLDRDTSGVLLAALNQETFDYLKALFQKHLVQKTYLALVHGEVKEKSGSINKPIGLKSGSTKRSVHGGKMKKEAITEYKVIKFFKLKGEDFTLLSVSPKTGRTHQIRVHLAAIGHPVAGDKLYGGKRKMRGGLNRHFLHAQSIEFTLPSSPPGRTGGQGLYGQGGERIKFEADLPADLKSFLESDQ